MTNLKSTFKPWFIWLCAAIFYCYEFCLQSSPNIMADELMHAFSADAKTFGIIASAYFYAYTLMQIPGGLLLDKLGPRKLLTYAALVCAIGSLIFSSAHHLSIVLLGRILIGLGSAFAVLGTLKIAANWFPLRRFALLTGLTVAIGMTGAVSAGAPLRLLINSIGWRESMLLFAIVGGLISLLIWSFVRDYPPQAKMLVPTTDNSHSQLGILQSLKLLMTSSQNWIIAIYGALMFTPTIIFAETWGATYLKTIYPIDNTVAGGATSMIFIGWALGSPFFGWVSDTIQRRKPTLILGSFGSLFTVLAILYIPMSIPLLYFILLLSGFLASGFLPSFSIIREINPQNISATVLGFMNTLNMMGGVILPPIIGWILDYYWLGNISQGVHVFSIRDYHVALAALPITISISILLLPFIRETYCQTHEVELKKKLLPDAQIAG